GEVEEDAGKESRLSEAEEKSKQIEHPGAAHEHRQRRDDPPRNHDAGDPDSRAQTRQREVARDLEHHVAQEKDSGAETIGRRGEMQDAVHLQRREAHVDAIEVGEDVQEKQKRNQAAADSSNRRLQIRILDHRLRTGVGHLTAHRRASSRSISSMTRFMAFTVRSSGSSVVMSTPASFSRSIGYFEPPAPRNARYLCVAAGSPDLTFAARASEAVNDVAYWNT